jgi:hypothetical protein
MGWEKNMNISKKKWEEGYIPKISCRHGFDDEGISSVLGKPRDFKYSDRFLKWWYTEMGNEK